MRKQKNRQQNNYGIFAGFYDRLMNQEKYSGWRRIIRNVIKKYKIPKGLCLDIACGTGKISEILASEGFQVLGIDKSKSMLAIAKKRLPRAEFIQADIRNFKLNRGEKISFAVSFYDSMNYLLNRKEIAAALNCISSNIPEGTIFLFDMNSRDHIKTAQEKNPIISNYEDAYIVLKSSGRGNIWILDMDFFIRLPSGKFELHKERHLERGYDKKDIAPLLRESGFKLLETSEEYRNYGDGKDRLSRTYFVAQKL